MNKKNENLKNSMVKCLFSVEESKSEILFRREKQVYSLEMDGKVDLKEKCVYFKKEGKFIPDLPFYLQNEIDEKSEWGFVYVFKIGGKYKIGSTLNIFRRKRQVQTSNWEEVKLIDFLVSKDYKDIEKKFHLFFSENRVANEFFDLEKRDIEFFKKIKEENNIISSV